jgi:hypothetical protein
MLKNVDEHRVHIATNLASRNPKRRDTKLHQILVASLILCRLGPAIVGLAINLNREPRGLAVEIEHIGAKRVLAAELQSFRPRPQRAPQRSLRRAHRAA